MGELRSTLETHIDISLPTNEVIHKGLRTEVGVPCFASRSSMMSQYQNTIEETYSAESEDQAGLLKITTNTPSLDSTER